MRARCSRQRGPIVPGRLFLLLYLGIVFSLTLHGLPSYARAESRMFEKMVAMRDGVRLHTIVYLPDPAIWPPPLYPAIVQRTPYGIGSPGVLPGPDIPSGAILKGWKAITAHGYAAVFQDMRGRFASEGKDRVYLDEGPDGYDMIEWVAAQPWCNGRVGMAGSSAGGIASYAAAGNKPPHLMAIFSQAGSANLYNEVIYEGQSLELERLLLWISAQGSGVSVSHIQSLGLTDKEYQEAATRSRAIYADLEKNMLQSGKSGWWMHLPLLGFPAVSRIQPLWNEILSHPNQDGFRDSQDYTQAISVPAIHVSAWHDIFLMSNLHAYRDVQERVGNQKLYIGPGNHDAADSQTFWPYDPFFTWFDHWLKGIDTGIMEAPPIYYSHSNSDRWRYTDQWPPSGVNYMTLTLHENGALESDPPSPKESPLRYVYDPQHPVQTLGGRNLMVPGGPMDQRPVEPPHRADVLVYTTAKIEKDVEIAGNVTVVLHASSTAKDTDFIAKLIDVHPDGSSMLVLDGVIRAMYRKSAREPVPLKPGGIHEFTIHLGDISHVFKAEHRIRVDVTSSNFPRRARNTNSGNPLYTADTRENIVVATNTIYHDPEHPSYLMLPVLATRVHRLFEGTARIKTPEGIYEGPCQLYTFPTAAYLHFRNRWMKWRPVQTSLEGDAERSRYDGKWGESNLEVRPAGNARFEATFSGPEVSFRGGGAHP